VLGGCQSFMKSIKPDDWKGLQIVQDLQLSKRLERCQKRLEEVRKSSVSLCCLCVCVYAMVCASRFLQPPISQECSAERSLYGLVCTCLFMCIGGPMYLVFCLYVWVTRRASVFSLVVTSCWYAGTIHALTNASMPPRAGPEACVHRLHPRLAWCGPCTLQGCRQQLRQASGVSAAAQAHPECLPTGCLVQTGMPGLNPAPGWEAAA
jgi:hypothetical protein